MTMHIHSPLVLRTVSMNRRSALLQRVCDVGAGSSRSRDVVHNGGEQVHARSHPPLFFDTRERVIARVTPLNRSGVPWVINEWQRRPGAPAPIPAPAPPLPQPRAATPPAATPPAPPVATAAPGPSRPAPRRRPRAPRLPTYDSDEDFIPHWRPRAAPARRRQPEPAPRRRRRRDRPATPEPVAYIDLLTQ